MRLAANDRSRSGWLISRATAAEPTSVAAMAIATQTIQVPSRSVCRRDGSACSQYGSRSMVKPTHSPATPLTLPATMVSGPRRDCSASTMVREKWSVPNGSQRSRGSRSRMRSDSWSVISLTSVTRFMRSA